jgi:uncharacterized protein (TIGR02598 family)
VNIHGGMNSSPTVLPRIRRKTAFSLVEVTMALGVVAVSLTSMLALMPAGLRIFRDSVESSARADILRKVTSELQQMPFSVLKSSVGGQSQERHFSDQGVEVAEKDFFSLRCVVGASANLLTGSSSAYDNVFLVPVQIEIFTHADRAANPPKPSFTTTVFVPESGI